MGCNTSKNTGAATSGKQTTGPVAQAKAQTAVKETTSKKETTMVSSEIPTGINIAIVEPVLLSREPPCLEEIIIATCYRIRGLEGWGAGPKRICGTKRSRTALRECNSRIIIANTHTPNLLLYYSSMIESLLI